MIIQLFDNSLILFFDSKISINEANWLSVSGVEPDFEMIIKPVLSILSSKIELLN